MRRFFLKYFSFLVLITVVGSCKPEPKIQMTDTLEQGLGKRYSDYVIKLNAAVDGDRKALHDFLMIKDIYDGATYEHGWVLIELMKIIGDRPFSEALHNVDTAQLNTLSSYFKGGLDMQTKGDKIPTEYPSTFKFLGINE